MGRMSVASVAEARGTAFYRPSMSVCRMPVDKHGGRPPLLQLRGGGAGWRCLGGTAGLADELLLSQGRAGERRALGRCCPRQAAAAACGGGDGYRGAEALAERGGARRQGRG